MASQFANFSENHNYFYFLKINASASASVNAGSMAGNSAGIYAGDIASDQPARTPGEHRQQGVACDGMAKKIIVQINSWWLRGPIAWNLKYGQIDRLLERKQ